jgi:hypothetical protein
MLLEIALWYAANTYFLPYLHQAFYPHVWGYDLAANLSIEYLIYGVKKYACKLVRPNIIFMYYFCISMQNKNMIWIW